MAPGYSGGKAQGTLGIALQGRWDEAVVATKVHIRAHEMSDVAGTVARLVDNSLRRLRMDSVNVLHVHNRFTERLVEVPDSLFADDALGPVLEAYRRMQDTGKTRYIGVPAMDHHTPPCGAFSTAASTTRCWPTTTC